MSCASALGLAADDATVLHASNRVTMRLMPCEVVARVAPLTYRPSAEFEIEVARRLAETGSPVAALEPRVHPRVYVHGDFVLNFWTCYESAGGVEPRDYAHALSGLHAGMRQVDSSAPHFTDRIAEAQRLVDAPAATPELDNADRALLSIALRELTTSIVQRGRPEQLLHGEPHPGNLLNTAAGPLFIDFETCCRGPVEFDVAHAPEAVAAHYPGTDPDMLHDCRLLTKAIVAAWRWDRNDHFPNGRQMGIELLSEVRLSFARHGSDTTH